MDPKEMREKVLEQKELVSSRISDLSRYVGFGLVAVVYATLTSEDSAAGQLFTTQQTKLLIAAGFGALAILFDYLQFFAGYLSVQKALKNEAGGYQYDDNSAWYWIRSIMFWAKQLMAVLGTAIFCWTIIVPIVSAPTN